MRKSYVVLSCLVLTFNLVAEPNRIGALKGGAQLLESARSQPLNLRVFDAVWVSVRKQYYDRTLKGVDWQNSRDKYRPLAAAAADEKALYQVINQMLRELRDGHTVAEGPTQTAHEKRQQRIGLGMTSEIIENQIVLTRVMKGSAADAAGVQPGWIMTHWDGTPMEPGRARRSSVQSGQTVRFRFVDPEDHAREVELAARPFRRLPDRKAQVIEGGVLYVRLDGFEIGAAKWFKEVLESESEARGCVIDLRGCPGGFFGEMRECLKPLFKRATVFGESVQRDGKRLPLRVPGAGEKAFAGEIVVLIDRMSYSAAEVFAAAITDSGRGKLVGRKSGGIALLALHKKLPDGGEVSVSFRDYIRRNGERIEGRGVHPDVEVSKKLEDLRRNVDRDLVMGIEVLNGRSSTLRASDSVKRE